MAVRYFALVLGIIYLVLGVLGFFPGFMTMPGAAAPSVGVTSGYGYLFGIFPVNVVHNIVHVLAGLWGILAYRTFTASRFYARAVAVIFGVLTVMGFIPVLNTTFGLAPIFGADIWLHGIIALCSIYFGWLAPAAREETPRIEREHREAA